MNINIITPSTIIPPFAPVYLLSLSLSVTGISLAFKVQFCELGFVSHPN